MRFEKTVPVKPPTTYVVEPIVAVERSESGVGSAPTSRVPPEPGSYRPMPE